MLQHIYYRLAEKYCRDPKLINQFWAEIENNYSDDARAYHTLVHLNHLLYHLNAVELEIRDWDSILFSLFYHDMIYDVLKQDNEERSAGVAKDHLQRLGFPEVKMKHCISVIMATKSHAMSTDKDTNFFTDADLSILGEQEATYNAYTLQIRQEYSNYPDLAYREGRKKVITHFLAMDFIFKTKYFYEKFEKQARSNLARELNSLA